MSRTRETVGIPAIPMNAARTIVLMVCILYGKLI
jgi:hypothetical protein